jgi:isoamylase
MIGSGGFLRRYPPRPRPRRGSKIIAEPWDIGPGGYQLGGFPAGTAEWNDRFRDTVPADSGVEMTGCHAATAGA